MSIQCPIFGCYISKALISVRCIVYFRSRYGKASFVSAFSTAAAVTFSLISDGCMQSRLLVFGSNGSVAPNTLPDLLKSSGIYL